MTRRLDNKATYGVETDLARYLVTLTHLKNDINGNPRLSANVIVLEVKGNEHPGNYYTTYSYNFTANGIGEENEARWICRYREEELKKALNK